MCVAQPNRASVPDSWRALSSAIVASAHAALLLLVAVATLPFRLLGRRLGGSQQRTRPAPVSHIGIEVHLDDRRCVAEIESALRATLERSARTWAPHRCPSTASSWAPPSLPKARRTSTTGPTRRPASTANLGSLLRR